jgi:predicted nucleic acid-binding protein
VLVLDASLAVTECLAATDFAPYASEQLVAPPLLWPETRSALHAMAWRGDASTDDARAAAERLDAAPIDARHPPALGRQAWQLADELGWARTYDAEYVALAGLLGCRLVTLDTRLYRRTAHLGYVLLRSEL